LLDFGKQRAKQGTDGAAKPQVEYIGTALLYVVDILNRVSRFSLKNRKPSSRTKKIA